MTHWKRLLNTATVGLALALGVALPAGRADAADKVHLKDGKVVEGKITREEGGFVWITTSIAGVEQKEWFGPDQIEKVEHDAASTPAKVEGAKEGEGGDAPASKTPEIEAAPLPTKGRPGVPKGVVITLGDEQNGDMVGLYMTAYAIEHVIPTLEQDLGTDHTGIVVFRVHSGGGALSEIQKLSDVIHNEYKKRWRTVAWIDWAISAAAMTSHCMDEIYFTTHAAYGACTGWYGPLIAVKGFQLEKVLAMMEQISARGGYDYRIMRSMQITEPLSATIDPNGTIHFFSDAVSGDFVVNRPGEILTLDSKLAEKIKFSKGTADTLPELTKAMGLQEVDWVGKDVKGVPWPVSRAEKFQMDFRKQVHEDEKETNTYYNNYLQNLRAAESEQNKSDRGKFVGRARQWLGKLDNMFRNNPNFIRNFFRSPEEFKKWREEQDKILRELMK